jgi:hypothetical protein
MAAAELFSNQATTTVASGGTDAPSSGTVETWTVASPGNFPSASSSSTPPTQFHVCDVATGKNSEIMAVTNVSGSTWTVTRGAEGSTPVTHSAGFTVQQVMTAGWLGSVVAPVNSPGAYLVPRASGVETGGGPSWTTAPPGMQVIWADLLPGVDPTGVADSTAALAAAQTAQGTNPYEIRLGVGTYLLGTSSNLVTFGPNQGITGEGTSYTTISYVGNATCIAVFESTFNDASVGGRLGGFTLDGYYAGSSAVGISWGNLQGARSYDIAIYGFSGGGILFANTSANWSEQGDWKDIRLVQNGGANGANVTFSNGSFDYSVYEFLIVANSGTDGVRLQDNAELQGCRLEIRGNFAAEAGNTGAVIAMGRGTAVTGDQSYVKSVQLDVAVETSGSDSGTGHYTLLMNSNNSASQFWGAGVFSFSTVTVPFQGVSNPQNLPFGFSGVINDPVVGVTAAGDGLGVVGGSSWSQANNITYSLYDTTIYWELSDIWAFQLGNGATAITFYASGITGRSRRGELLIMQPSSGAAGTLTWPENVKWSSGSFGGTLSTVNGTIDKAYLTYYPSNTTWYAELFRGYA